jgi:hypothetical protein
MHVNHHKYLSNLSRKPIDRRRAKSVGSLHLPGANNGC